MNMPETYKVVGCKECEQIWMYKGEQKTTQCPRCRTTHDTDSLRKYTETESIETAREIRTQLLIDQSNVDSEQFV